MKLFGKFVFLWFRNIMMVIPAFLLLMLNLWGLQEVISYYQFHITPILTWLTGGQPIILSAITYIVVGAALLPIHTTYFQFIHRDKRLDHVSDDVAIQHEIHQDIVDRQRGWFSSLIMLAKYIIIGSWIIWGWPHYLKQFIRMAKNGEILF